MAKLTLNDVSNITGNPTSAAATINNNSDAIETALENTLSRDGTSPNEMNADLDMNSNRILNLPEPVNASEPLRLQDLIDFNGGGSIGGGGGIGAIDIESRVIAISQEIESDINIIQTHGCRVFGDGGGAVYKRAAVEPGHFAKFQSADGAWWEQDGTEINPRQFGASGVLADDTAAFTEAAVTINQGPYRTLRINGEFFVNNTFTFTKDAVAIIGDGPRASLIHMQAAQDLFRFEDIDPSVGSFLYFTVRDLGITYDGAGALPLAGTMFKLTRCLRGYFTNLHLAGAYQTFDINGGGELFFDDITAVAGGWPSVATGSFLFRTRKTAPANNSPSEIFINNFNWKGFGSAPNYTLENCIIINDGDGIFFSNGHCGFSWNSVLWIRPTDINTAIQGMSFDNVFFDGAFGGDPNSAAILIDGPLSPACVGHSFLNCNASLHDGDGIKIDMSTLRDFRWIGSTIGHSGKRAINVINGDRIQIKDSYFEQNNRSNGGFNCIDLASSEDSHIIGNHIVTVPGAPIHPIGLNIASTCNNTIVMGNTILGHTTQLTNLDVFSQRALNVGETNFVQRGGGVFSVTRSNASTNGVVNVSRIIAESTGDMVNGFGPSESFRIRDTGIGETEIARIDAIRTGADNTGDLVLNAVNAGSVVPVARAVASTSALSLPGGRLQFPVVQNLSSDATTLDDYREGLWTPAITFTTPGDLSVTYSAQNGSYVKVGGLVMASFNIVTSSFTHTTASGSFTLTGIPFTSANLGVDVRYSGSCQWGGITMSAGYTDLVTSLASNAVTVTIGASGSAVGSTALAASNVPSGGLVLLRGTLVYRAA